MNLLPLLPGLIMLALFLAAGALDLYLEIRKNRQLDRLIEELSDEVDELVKQVNEDIARFERDRDCVDGQFVDDKSTSPLALPEHKHDETFHPN